MTPSDRGRRRPLRGALLVLFLVGAVWFAVLAISGGFDASVFGITITTHEPLRPLVLSVVALVCYAAAGGRFSVGALSSSSSGVFVRTSRLFLQHAPSPRIVAWLLAAWVCGVGFVYGSKTCGGSDSWGYLSLSELWLKGDLAIDQSFARVVPWPKALESFTPLAYRQSYHGGSWKIVPVYSSGFPLLLAAAKLIGGDAARFWIVPVCGTCLVLVTFGIGRRLASPAAGLIGAWLVATSPAILQLTVVMLSDIPTAAAWGLAFYLLLGASAPRAIGAGLAAGLAVLIRPNHVPLVPVLGLYYVWGLVDRDLRRQAFTHGALFALGASVGIAATAVINNWVYGSPLRSGYGALGPYFATSGIVPNLHHYLGWMVDSQTPLALVGAAALFVPMRRWWPKASRRALAVAALFVATLWALYLVYTVFDAWWYLRFLLASWPFIMLGTGAVMAWLMAWRSPLVRAAIVIVVAGVGLYQFHLSRNYGVYENWVAERRYISGALMTARLTGPNSVVMSMQHSGSVRYYGGRMTMRYDVIGKDDIDSVVAWLTGHGVHVYLLVEDWELAQIDSWWDRTHTMDALEVPPIATFDKTGELHLYDLSSPRKPGDATEFVTDVDRGLFVPGPGPEPHLVFQP